MEIGSRGDIYKINGRFYFENSAMLAFKHVENAFAGDAQKVGFEHEEELQAYMKEIRKEVRGD